MIGLALRDWFVFSGETGLHTSRSDPAAIPDDFDVLQLSEQRDVAFYAIVLTLCALWV
jgi:hypothetical protein